MLCYESFVTKQDARATCTRTGRHVYHHGPLVTQWANGKTECGHKVWLITDEQGT